MIKKIKMFKKKDLYFNGLFLLFFPYLLFLILFFLNINITNSNHLKEKTEIKTISSKEKEKDQKKTSFFRIK